MKQDAENKKTQLEIDINLMRFGSETSFVKTNTFDESYVFGATNNENKILGLAQIDERLSQIRTQTSVNHSDLELNKPAILTELKTIRRGAVYQNNDIRDSKTLFIAAKDYLEEHIYPVLNVSISSVSILQTYEGYEDWDKVRIGEIVSINVPQLKIDVEAEIQELSIDFQNYSTSITISTIDRYDKSFGKMFANTMLQAEETEKNNVAPFENQNNEAGKIIAGGTGKVIKQITDGSGTYNEFGEVRNVFLQERLQTPDKFFAQFEEEKVVTSGQKLTAKYIDIASGSLTETKPPYYIEEKGAAEITNGSVLVKDSNEQIRIKLSASEGFVAYKTEIDGSLTESVKIDLDGNATFAGNLSAATGTFTGDLVAAGGTFNGTLQVGATLSDGTTTLNTALTNLNSAITTINTDIGNLGDQIDGAIDTWFYNGAPTLSNEPAVNWTTTELKNAHLGDIYYDNDSGYAYRFVYENIVDDDPDAGTIYYWQLISDSAVVEALELVATAKSTADGKMTFFTAGTSAQLDSALDPLTGGTVPKDGDILIPSADFTHTTPDPDVAYKADTIYKYSQSAGVFEPEEKKDGSVGGWTINATTIESNNDRIVLDAANNKINVGNITLQGNVASANSYIGLNKTSYTPSTTPGIYLGLDNSVAKLSVGTDSRYLTWDGTSLNVKGNLNVATDVNTIKSVTTGSTLIISNIDYNGSQSNFATDFGTGSGLSVQTGSYQTVTQTSYAWISLVNYTGIALATDSLPTASVDFLGDIYYQTTDSTYYQCIQTAGNGYVTVTIDGTAAGYNLSVIESATTTTQYRAPRTRFTHTFSSGRYVSFDLSFQFTDDTSDFAGKTVYISYDSKGDVKDIFDLFLASTGVSSVVNSINGQVGDVEIATGGSLTEVGLSLPTDVFNITIPTATGSSGTLTAELKSQTQKTFLGAPNGENGVPTFRQIDYSDLTGTAPSAFNGGTIENDLTISNTTPTLNFVDTSSQIDDFDISVNTNRFTINNTTTDNDLMTITQNGKVGIGTISPLNKLEVRHTGVDGDNGILITKVDSAITAGEYLGGIGFDATDGNAPSSVLEASAYIAAYASEDHATTDKGGQLAFGLASIDQDDDTVSIEKMRLRDTGLEVFGNLTSAGGFMSDDLYLLYDGPTSGQDQDYDSHGIIFQI